MSYIGNSPGNASQRVVTQKVATAGQTRFASDSGYATGYVDVIVNGSDLVAGVDFNETGDGINIDLVEACAADDNVKIVAYIPRGLSDGYTKPEANALLALKADLVAGKIPSSQLPAYVDDVLEYANLAAFPATGSAGIIYVAQDTNNCYRWSGSAYIVLTDLSSYYTKTQIDAINATHVDKTSSTGGARIPVGTTAQRPTGELGLLRMNSTNNNLEIYGNNGWILIGAKDGSSYSTAADSAVALYDLGIRGKGLFWIKKADGAPIQVYCDLDTVGADGKAGWMLVASWATASEWTKDSVSSSSVFSTTALNAFSSNFGNTLMNHMRVKVSTAPDTAPSSSQADWYYYWGSTQIQWKTVWAAGSGTNNHYNSVTGSNGGTATQRNSLRQFSYAYNIKYAYTADYQIWANISDSGTSGSTGTEAWYDWYSGLTNPGYTLGVYNAGGAGRGDGSLAITFSGDTSNTAGHDCNYANAKYGYDDTGLAAWGGDTGVHNMNAQNGTNGINNNMWIWIK